MKREMKFQYAVLPVSLTLLMLGVVPTARAEELVQTEPESLLTAPKPRQGYYFGIGAVGGAAGFYHHGDGWLPVFGGGGGDLHIGQGLNDHIALGLDIGFMGGANADRNLFRGHIALELKWNLFEHWFLRPSIGFGFADFYRRRDNVEKVLGTISGSYTLAAGYDFIIGKKQYGSGGYTVSPMVWINGANGINLHSLAGGIGVEITRWGGLDKNQLKLPTNQAF